MKNVIVLIGAGQIGQAIARRVGVGKHVVLADMRSENANAAAEVMANAGYEVSVATVDASPRDAVRALVDTATRLGDVTGLIHAAGVSPSQASPATILKVDLYGTALVLEEFGNVIARGGSGVVIASQSGHRLPGLSVEENTALATTPVEELLSLPFLQLDVVTDSLHAYQISKRGNSLRVMAEAVRWGRRGARINTISPGIIITPLARDELTGPRGAGYQRMIDVSAAGRAGTPDEVATVGALLMGPDGGFSTGSDFLMDGGVTAAYWFGDLAPRTYRRALPNDAAAQSTRATQRNNKVKITRSGSHPSAKGPADWFTGTVRIDAPFQAGAPARVGGATVTFEPGARTAWHTHPLGQTLFVTFGLGRVQREGAPIEEIRPGDIVWFEPDEKHWHGASPTTAMQHIAVAEALDGKAVEWMEKVSDEQYEAGSGVR
ncbi:MAG TPA: SDR family oxidoreductase [Gemmatimonadaceae bacterium]